MIQCRNKRKASIITSIIEPSDHKLKQWIDKVQWAYQEAKSKKLVFTKQSNDQKVILDYVVLFAVLRGETPDHLPPEHHDKKRSEGFIYAEPVSIISFNTEDIKMPCILEQQYFASFMDGGIRRYSSKDKIYQINFTEEIINQVGPSTKEISPNQLPQEPIQGKGEIYDAQKWMQANDSEKIEILQTRESTQLPERFLTRA